MQGHQLRLLTIWLTHIQFKLGDWLIDAVQLKFLKSSLGVISRRTELFYFSVSKEMYELKLCYGPVIATELIHDNSRGLSHFQFTQRFYLNTIYCDFNNFNKALILLN